MTQPTLRIRNWDKWQSYRADRGQPPWIKIYRSLLRDENWVDLSDAQRGQLVAIWMLAADRDGEIPASASLIKKLCYMDEEPDLQLFVDKGFIEPDANLTPSRRQADASVTAQSREETETEAEEEGAEAPDRRYAFEGRVVRLNHKDFAAWKRGYASLDLESELLGRDAWLAEQPPDVKKHWFASTSKYLANQNMRARSMGKPKGPADVEYAGCLKIQDL